MREQKSAVTDLLFLDQLLMRQKLFDDRPGCVIRDRSMVAEIQGVAAAALQRHSNAASGRLDGVNERALTTTRPRTCETGAHYDCLDCSQTSLIRSGVVATPVGRSSDEATCSVSSLFLLLSWYQVTVCFVFY